MKRIILLLSMLALLLSSCISGTAENMLIPVEFQDQILKCEKTQIRVPDGIPLWSNDNDVYIFFSEDDSLGFIFFAPYDNDLSQAGEDGARQYLEETSTLLIGQTFGQQSQEPILYSTIDSDSADYSLTAVRHVIVFNGEYLYTCTACLVDKNNEKYYVLIAFAKEERTATMILFDLFDNTLPIDETGTNTSDIPSSNTWICPTCGASNTTNFCGNCGAARPAENDTGFSNSQADAKPDQEEMVNITLFRTGAQVTVPASVRDLFEAYYDSCVAIREQADYDTTMERYKQFEDLSKRVYELQEGLDFDSDIYQYYLDIGERINALDSN